MFDKIFDANELPKRRFRAKQTYMKDPRYGTMDDAIRYLKDELAHELAHLILADDEPITVKMAGSLIELDGDIFILTEQELRSLLEQQFLKGQKNALSGFQP
jgi:hypothetical protein